MSANNYASFVAKGYSRNAIFDLGAPENRDNCQFPFYLLREKFIEHGFELNTVDLAAGTPNKFDIHLNVQEASLSNFCYLLMLEAPQVYRNNGLENKLCGYRKIFTWDDARVDGEKFIKINFPNIICAHPVDGFYNRDRFCCLIAGNKTLNCNDVRNLYPERVNAIRWFELNAPEEFDLFGVDWDMPVLHPGMLGKIERSLFRKFGKLLGLQPFVSYRGRVEHKGAVLAKTRFSICYENVRDIPGYITEKIFDCFFSGCVPVYWGANNITDYIPSDCFIDRRNFSNMGEVYAFMKAMSEEEFRGYQERIAEFLTSDQSYPFSAEFFAETIVEKIVQDVKV